MQGWVLRAGGPPPALSGVFLPRFFLRYRRKNRAPGGRKQACLEEIRIRKTPTTAACKLAPCVESASAAASGQHTRPDDGCSHKSAWQLVQCAAVLSTPTQGGGYVGRGTPRPARRLSFHILSSPEKKEYGPRRAIASLHGKNSDAKNQQKCQSQPARSAKKKTSLRPSPMGKPHESLVTIKWHSSQAAARPGMLRACRELLPLMCGFMIPGAAPFVKHKPAQPRQFYSPRIVRAMLK